MCSTLPDFSQGIDKNLSPCKWGMVRPSLRPVKEKKKRFHPLNPKYDDMELNKDIEYRIVGVVIEKKKRYR